MHLIDTGGKRTSRGARPTFTVYDGDKGRPAATTPMLQLTGPAARDAIGDALAPPTRAQAPVTHGYDAAPYHTAAIEEAAGSRGPQPKPWIMDLPSTHPEW